MRSLRPLALAGVLLIGAAGCSGDDATSTGSSGTGARSTEPARPAETEPTAPRPATAEPTVTEPPTASPTPSCDARDPRACLLPWPNDAFTVADPTTPTGRRLALPGDGTPRNADGVPIDVTGQNRADGFSPGSAILLFAPDTDLAASGVAPSTDIGASLDGDAPIVLTDATTGERWPYWAELDAQAPSGEQLLMIRPAEALTEGHRYEVEVRDLRRTDGSPVALPLPLAWSFTVASAESLAGRLLSMIDAADAELGDTAPAFTVTSTEEAGSVRTVEGTFQLPNHLDNDGSPGGRFLLGDDGRPVRNEAHPIYDARFRCVVPTAPAAPVPTVVYGHGLLGSRAEVDFFAAFAEQGLAAGCATDWIGMSSDDVPTVLELLADLSRFAEQADRLQHAHLAFDLLGRLVNLPDGFASDPAFQGADGTPVIAAGGAVFVGNSQGGILGGATTAVTRQWPRAVLGVPGMNYSLLLTRSSDWPEFQAVFDVAYPDPVDRVLAIQLAQLLWDRGENQGYAQHLARDPYPGRDPKPVLLVEAFGDHQVANVATEVLARTIGARAHSPALRPGRSLDVAPLWGIDPIPAYPDPGPALVVWDFGTPPPPTVNRPPTSPQHGTDPHGAGSEEPLVLQQALTFLLTGAVTDVCGGAPCVGRQLDG